MSSSMRLSDSSDDEEAPNVLNSADDDNRWGSVFPASSDSDSEDLEVVESEGTPHSSNYERNNYQEDIPVQMSHFYNQSYDSDKNEQEPSYSLDEPTNQIEFNDFDSSYEKPSGKKHSKKKKEKSSNRNNDSSPDKVPSSNKKGSKRKNDYQAYEYAADKRFRFEDSFTQNNENKRFTRSKSRARQTSISEESSSSSNDGVQEGFGFKSDYSSLPSEGLGLPDISDELIEKKTDSHSRKETRKSLKRKNPSENTNVNTRISASNKGNLLMQKMGYKEGEGLGKHAQGRIDPVELSKQKGRRGLGLSLPGLDNEKIEWDPNLEEISVVEPVDWLENPDLDSLDFEIMLESWLSEGPKNLDIESMTDFIDEEILSSILRKKTVFDNLTDDELRKTVLRSNPFESLRKGIFMNRAALKMANMDSVFEYMFSNPRCKDGSPMVKDNEVLYFADVCAGPGGFSEYILWRKKWRAKGFGFTLKGDCDFKIQDFIAGPSETFEAFYGDNDDGNIYDPDNITSLTKFVMEATNNLGVHFMMADGGFSVKGQENIQELLSKQLYLCQFLVALSIVRPEGHFVCKLFDVVSPFSAGLVYLMYRAFDKICIFKPNTSRPANSERYIVCKHKRADTEPIREYLFQINVRMWKLGQHSEVDISECVPVDIMKDSNDFFNYLRDSNNRIGNRQIVNLDKIVAFFQDPNLHEANQNELRKKCMEQWKVPSMPRRVDQSTDIEVTKNIMKATLTTKFKPESIQEILNMRGKKLDPKILREIIGFSILDWECVPMGSEKLIFLLGLGRNRVYQWGGSKWEQIDKLNIELPAGTLLYGEFVPEYRGEGLKQKKIMAFHIVDGISIGYEIIAWYHFDQRISLLNLFTTSLKKWRNKSLCPIRVKDPTEMKDIHYIYRRLSSKFMKGGSCETCLTTQDENEEDYFLQMKGICFIRTTKEPWHKHFSKSTNLYYYFNSSTGQSLYENHRPPDAVASTMDSLKNQIVWVWENGVGFKGEPRVSGVLHNQELLEYIQKKCN